MVYQNFPRNSIRRAVVRAIEEADEMFHIHRRTFDYIKDSWFVPYNNWRSTIDSTDMRHCMMRTYYGLQQR